ncbi:hypothetical protein [Acinetobacter sp. TUM15071]|uniref:hypothetical protein n=1 Tax=Acinetobacter sp. TUM15071 TaxID=2609135 RepID=UPI00124C246D|nr:hypothetical protein [Acinetobacter sp. TUM15071]
MITQVYGNLQHFKDQIDEWQNVVTEKLDSYSNFIDHAFAHFNDTNNSADYQSVEQINNRHSLESLTSEKNIADAKINELVQLINDVAEDACKKLEILDSQTFNEIEGIQEFGDFFQFHLNFDQLMKQFLDSMQHYEVEYLDSFNTFKSKNSLSSIFRGINNLRHNLLLQKLQKITASSQANE